jgi:hypothetical protein
MVTHCGGGYFHTPPGLLAGSPLGEPAYLSLTRGTQCVGVALGVRHTTPRRGLRSRMVWQQESRGLYFPTLPAFAPGLPARAALPSLEQALRGVDVVSARFDSFDASWCPDAGMANTHNQLRREYVMSFDRLDDENVRLRLCHTHHRRHIRRGERAGWTLRRLDGDEARRVLGNVLRSAASRSAQRGDAFASALPTIAEHAGTDLSKSWGAVVWSVWDAATPLAAAAVGYANGAAYFINGGSTPLGYAGDASIWMHWRIGQELAAAGFKRYNLGGTPAGACDPHHSAHGLFRFKSGFGGVSPNCSGLRWSFVNSTTDASAREWFGGSGR